MNEEPRAFDWVGQDAEPTPTAPPPPADPVPAIPLPSIPANLTAAQALTILDSPEWLAANSRRADLIYKKKLDTAESAEFDRLQLMVRRLVETAHPRPISFAAEIEALQAKLAAKATGE